VQSALHVSRLSHYLTLGDGKVTASVYTLRPGYLSACVVKKNNIYSKPINASAVWQLQPIL